MSFKNKVVYQIWPRSFQDSNGDGIGDLPGILSRLSYLKNLGVDLIWLSPVYKSPNHDYGYDVEDYQSIHPDFGSMEDMERLIREAERLNMGILMDLVANHTSDTHAWFQEALKDPTGEMGDFYYFREGVKGGPPNNWMSAFGGSAWQKDEKSGLYYLTTFTPHQPDLNWSNPKLRQAIYDMMNFWMDKGIHGFRLDVINLIDKKEGLPSVATKDPLAFPFDEIISLPKSHDYLQEMNREVFSKYDYSFSVGEGMLLTPEDLCLYTKTSRNELNMCFQFDLLLLGCGELGKFDFRKGYRWNVKDFKNIFKTWQESSQICDGWVGNFLSNHDGPRAVSRYVHKNHRRSGAKALGLLNMTLRGTPFLYQGEEIGMTNQKLDQEDWKDFEAKNTYKLLQSMFHLPKFIAKRIINKMSRDQGRSPMQWSSKKHAGFSTTTPWMKLNPNYTEINVQDESKHPDSILRFYQTLIELRKNHLSLQEGRVKWIEVKDPLMAYTRQHGEERLLVLINFSPKKTKIPKGLLAEYSLLLGTHEQSLKDKKSMAPYEAMILKA